MKINKNYLNQSLSCTSPISSVQYPPTCGLQLPCWWTVEHFHCLRKFCWTALILSLQINFSYILPLDLTIIPKMARCTLLFMSIKLRRLRCQGVEQCVFAQTLTSGTSAGSKQVQVKINTISYKSISSTISNLKAKVWSSLLTVVPTPIPETGTN